MARIAYALLFGFAGIIAVMWFMASTIAPNPGIARFLGVVFQIVSTVGLIKFLVMKPDNYRFEIKVPEEMYDGQRNTRQALH